MLRVSVGVVTLSVTVLLGSACSSRSELKPVGGTAGAAAGTSQAGGVGGTIGAGGVVSGGVGGVSAGASGTSTCLVTECILGPCVPAGQPRPNLCGCPIRDCDPDGGVGGSAGTLTGGAISTGGSGGTTGSGNCTVSPGDPPPSVDEVTGLTFTAPTTVKNNPPDLATLTADKAHAQDLYKSTLALPVAQPVTKACLGGLAVPYQLTFSLIDGSKLTVAADPTGCSYVDIPGTCVRSPDDAYWTHVADAIGIPAYWIFPSPQIPHPTFFVPDGGIGDACVTDIDCPAGLSCGYLVAGGCATKGVCVQSNCQNGACLTPAGMCGCDGQTILPVQSQQLSPNSTTIAYASAPSSGKIGPCMGIPDAGFTADASTLVCSLTSGLTFGSNGGRVSSQDSFVLDTVGHLTVTRTYYGSMDGPSARTCSPTLPACGASGAVSISTIAQDLADADVQFAFGLTLSHVYGVDNRPSDGAVWSITRASGGNILVGTQCPSLYMNSCQPIPAGIQRLADDLRSLAYTAEVLPACAGL
jgi:hypothetical protein